LASLGRPKTITVSAQSSAAAVNQAVSPQEKELNVSSKEKLFGRYEDKWLGEVSLCKTNFDATFASRFSPRFRGRLLSIKQERIANPVGQSGTQLRRHHRCGKNPRFTFATVHISAACRG